MFKPVTFKALSIWCHTLIEMFFLQLKTISELVDFDDFWCFCHLLFHLFHISKRFLSFFIWENKKKTVVLGEIRWTGRLGNGGHAVFGQKCWTCSVVWAGALVNHPSWNGQVWWKSLQKNSLKLNTACHSNATWYTDMDGFLEHSPSRESLYRKGPAL